MTERDEIDEETFMDLDASLAPCKHHGRAIDRDLQLRIDGRYTLELLKTGYNGMLLHNLPPEITGLSCPMAEKFSSWTFR